MLCMSFPSFIVLLIISVVASLILHYWAKLLVTEGVVSLLSKIVIGWIGAWLGSPVFGNWFAGLAVDQVFIIPAILGSFAAEIVAIDAVRTLAKALGDRPAVLQ